MPQLPGIGGAGELSKILNNYKSSVAGSMGKLGQQSSQQMDKLGMNEGDPRFTVTHVYGETGDVGFNTDASESALFGFEEFEANNLGSPSSPKEQQVDVGAELGQNVDNFDETLKSLDSNRRAEVESQIPKEANIDTQSNKTNMKTKLKSTATSLKDKMISLPGKLKGSAKEVSEKISDALHDVRMGSSEWESQVARNKPSQSNETESKEKPLTMETDTASPVPKQKSSSLLRRAKSSLQDATEGATERFEGVTLRKSSSEDRKASNSKNEVTLKKRKGTEIPQKTTGEKQTKNSPKLDEQLAKATTSVIGESVKLTKAGAHVTKKLGEEGLKAAEALASPIEIFADTVGVSIRRTSSETVKDLDKKITEYSDTRMDNLLGALFENAVAAPFASAVSNAQKTVENASNKLKTKDKSTTIRSQLQAIEDSSSSKSDKLKELDKVIANLKKEQQTSNSDALEYLIQHAEGMRPRFKT